jgi:hypothetical protein
MQGGGELFSELLGYLEKMIGGCADPRPGSNLHYELRDFFLSAFAVFFSQSPSFLSHQTLMEKEKGTSNARSVFAIRGIPTDNQIRGVLDMVDPALVRPAFGLTVDLLRARGVIDSFRFLEGKLLLALDGTGYFFSESIHCPSCTVHHHRDGRTTYSHSVLLPVLVRPERSQVIPLEPEFITPQDGHEKQDCEYQAAKRWLEAMGSRYAPLGVVLLGDDLFASQPMIEKVRSQQMSYIFVAKPSSHKYLYEELAGLEKLKGLQEVRRSHWTGRAKRTVIYRYVNGVGLNARSSNGVEVNWVEITILNDKGKQTFHSAFITDLLITAENVASIVEAGRCRWKIENENNNTLKTKGYHFEHNFGHGQNYLSCTLLSLNVLAFLFHTVLELLDKRVALLRASLPRRDTFYQHLAALTQYWQFENWRHLVLFMLQGLGLEDPDG